MSTDDGGRSGTATSAAAASGIVRVTEAVDLVLATERWACNRCGRDLGPGTGNYKEACLLAARHPSEVHQPFRGDPEYSFTPDGEWCAIVEVYCPGCATLLDTEYLPPGHPPTHDVQIDLEALRAHTR